MPPKTAIPPKKVIEPNELKAFQDDFRAHFRLKGDKPIGVTRRAFSWQQLDFLVKFNTNVHAITIHYGVVAGSFLPVIQLTRLDDNGDFEPVPEENYIFDEVDEVMRKLTDAQRVALVERYLNDVEVKRKTAPGFTVLKPLPHAQADPTSAIFPWSSHVAKLMNDSDDGTVGGAFYLIVTCISTTDLEAPGYDKDEFRHALAINAGRMVDVHGARVVVDLLAQAPKPDTYRGKALDYGNLCPPRCKK